jgi:bifunctional non-homologous end joining protein LigD
MFAHACSGWKALSPKVRDSRYLSVRGRDWVKTTCAQRETLTIAGFALDGNDWDGIYVGRRKGSDLQGRSRLRQEIIRRTAQAPHAPNPQKPALHKADRAQGHLGGAGIARRNRVPRQTSRRKGPPPFFKGLREDL